MVPSMHVNGGQGNRAGNGSKPEEGDRQSAGHKAEVWLSKPSNPLYGHDESTKERNECEIGRDERRRRATSASRGRILSFPRCVRFVCSSPPKQILREKASSHDPSERAKAEAERDERGRVGSRSSQFDYSSESRAHNGALSAQSKAKPSSLLFRFSLIAQKIQKNEQEKLLLDSSLDSSIPPPLRHLLLAGVLAESAKLSGYPRELFDRVLLDPPCSALGLRPRLSHDVTMKDLLGYRSYQRQFIEVAVQLLRVGGILVYSTCRTGGRGSMEGTYDPLENEENVAFILKEFPMKLVPIEKKWKFGRSGLENCGLNRKQCAWALLEER